MDWLRESSWRRDKKAAASSQPELCPVWERIYLFYLIIITIKLVGIFFFFFFFFFVTIKKTFVLLFSMVLASVLTLAGKNVSFRSRITEIGKRRW